MAYCVMLWCICGVMVYFSLLWRTCWCNGVFYLMDHFFILWHIVLCYDVLFLHNEVLFDIIIYFLMS